VSRCGCAFVFLSTVAGSGVFVPASPVQVIQEMYSLLVTVHPTGAMWVNAQQYSQGNLTALMQLLDEPVRACACVGCGVCGPAHADRGSACEVRFGSEQVAPLALRCALPSPLWLRVPAVQATRAFVGGIVYGPHERLSMLDYLAAMPAGYPLRQYPDICHTEFSQFEVNQWSFALATTHGRQAVFPMPRMVRRCMRVCVIAHTCA
jgi:hypothetical protein